MSKNTTQLEHINLTVANPHEIAETLQAVFGWEIRWEGPSTVSGYTVHVGNDDQYLALWSPSPNYSNNSTGAMNHIGVIVDDLNSIRAKADQLGLATSESSDYEPGNRFYFYDSTGIEYEVVSYQN